MNTDTISVLCDLGNRLDERPPALEGETVRDLLISSLLKVRSKTGAIVGLQPNRAQFDYSRRSGRRNIVLKARQMGITTYIGARFFISTITRPGTVSVQVAHDQRSAQELFRIVHRFQENLPEWLRRDALVTSYSNVGQMVFSKLDSEYRIETAADPQAGRGLTIHNLHASELARWPRDPAETLASLRAAVAPLGEICLESTANGAGGSFYDEWQRAPETGYVRHFFPWWWEPSYRANVIERRDLRPDEQTLVDQQGLTLEQIAFRRSLQANFGGLARQEFAEDPTACFLESGSSVFDLDAVASAISRCPSAIESRNNGALLVWWPARKTAAQSCHSAGGGYHPPETRNLKLETSRYSLLGTRYSSSYIIGVDPAGGGSDGDYACAEVIDRSSGLQCAELLGHFTPLELASRVATLGREYNNALVAVERNNHGYAVLAHLLQLHNYTPLYEQSGQPGWLTTAASRPRMIENFAAVLSSSPHLFSSSRLLAECRTFIRRKDGSPAAATGCHDDCIMAMSIALAVREADSGNFSRNSSEYRVPSTEY